MSEKQLPSISGYLPTTFLERGVALPFTTPRLAGTRARPTEKHGLELLILNPSGRRGIYILPSSKITSFCRPTLHDAVFNERAGAVESVTPSMIRAVATQVAQEGYAGEEAQEAATRAIQNEKGIKTITSYRLLMALTDQVAALPGSPCVENGRAEADPGARERRMVAWISPRLGWSTSWTANAVEDLGGVFSTIGVGPPAARSRIPRLVALLRQIRDEISEWNICQRDEMLTPCLDMIRAMADLTLSLTETTMAEVSALSQDMVGLLGKWAVDPESMSRLTGRPEWLLDGWEQICLLWQQAEGDAGRRAVLAEIVALVPILPQEASDWSRNPSLLADELRARRMVSINEDWRTGEFVLDTVRRNENLRARAC